MSSEAIGHWFLIKFKFSALLNFYKISEIL